MATADAACQTLMVHMFSLKMEDALNKIFDQEIRCNMRLQDLRTRMKDLQDDMRVVKRQLNIEEAQGKRFKFAIDPTEVEPKDYSKDELDRTTRKLGSSSKSSLLDHCSDVSKKIPKLKLWTASSEVDEKKEDLEKAQASKP